MSGFALAGAGPRQSGLGRPQQLTDGDGHHQEDEQLERILRPKDAEGEEGRQEEEIEGQESGDRRRVSEGSPHKAVLTPTGNR